MDLKDFVKTTLIEIASGVREAQVAVREHGGLVNPTVSGAGASSTDAYYSQMHGGLVFTVKFDVLVSATESSGTSANVSLQVLSLVGLSAGGASNSDLKSANHIQFQVPMMLPRDPDELKFEEERKLKIKSERDERIRERSTSAELD